MTAPRDPDRLIGAFLEEGPEVLPVWVYGAVRDDIHHERQRASRGPWRVLIMRKYFATAAAAAVVMAGVAIWATRPLAPDLGNRPEPTQIVPAVQTGAIASGSTYRTDGFSQPFRFTVPETWGAAGASADLMEPHSYRIRPLRGGAITFHDDAALSDDLCRPTGLAADFTTPDDVHGWLAGSEGITVGSEHQIVTADNRNAFAWNIGIGADCAEGEPPGSPAVWLSPGEHHRVYAVPSGDDVIVVITWGMGYGGEGEEILPEINEATDNLVRSMSAAE